MSEPDRELFLRRFPEELRATAEQIPSPLSSHPSKLLLPRRAGQVWLVKSRAVGDSLRSNQVSDEMATWPARSEIMATAASSQRVRVRYS